MTPAHEIERSRESSLVTEEGSVNKVGGGAVFWRALDEGKGDITGCNTFSMAVHLRELKQGVGVIGLCT